MAPKKKKEIDQDERFQAIVLTDSFLTRFMPLTSKHPRCLLPLANVPLIEYTLEFLSKLGVNEVYLMCSSHAERIQEYMELSKWSKETSPFTITTILSLELKSVGDTMRDLDNRGLITGDFLLISGDVVSNMDFSDALKFHKHKKLIDKECILTTVLATASPYHRNRTQIDSATFFIDKTTDRCIYYQGIPPPDQAQTGINIDFDLLDDVREILIRNDLIDCHIDICTPLVPQIFQDNFDYQLLRSDFVKGVLTSDLVKKTVYAYITDSYAARISSFQTYDAISQDILKRWTYPLVPDLNLSGTAYRYETNHIYKEHNVVLAQSSKIGHCVCIGKNTHVDDGSTILKSVIGSNVKIGRNCRIVNSYILDGVVIGDNTAITRSVVAGNVGSNVDITQTVIGEHVVIGDDTVVPRNSRIIDKPIEKQLLISSGDDSDETSDLNESASDAIDIDKSFVGNDGLGYLYVSEDEDSASEENEDNISHKISFNFKLLNLSDESITSISKKQRKHKNRRLSTTSAISTDFENISDEGEEDEEEDFNKEAIDTVTRSIENNHDLDTALLELNTLRMSMNVTYHEVRMATVQSLIKRVLHFITTKTLTPKDAVSKVFKVWGPLFQRQVFEPLDQVDLLQILQTEVSLCDQSYFQVLLFWSIQILYQLDIVEEEMIYKWWDLKDSLANDKLVQVKGATEKFIDWLREAEEESD